MNGQTMKGIVAAFTGMLVMACAGCGGGGGGPVAAPPAPPKAVQISAAGDSTMAGLELINGQYVVTDVVRKDLQADLQARFDTSVTVIANARSGATLKNMIEGTGFPQTYAQYLATDKSQIVIENFAINDFGKEQPDEFGQYLADFISATMSAEKIPVLEEPSPSCPDGSSIYQSPLVSVINRVATTYGVAIVHQSDYLANLPGYCSMLTDGTHPNDALYAIKAQREADVLAPIVKSIQ